MVPGLLKDGTARGLYLERERKQAYDEDPRTKKLVLGARPEVAKWCQEHRAEARSRRRDRFTVGSQSHR